MPRNKNGTVGIKSDRPALRVVCEPPRRRTNREVRVREYLTTEELQRLIKAARKHGRNSGRDALMIAMATRHGLRASELCSMLWSQIDWKTARLTVLRNKGSVDSTHPLTGGELRALRAIRRGVGDDARYVFMSELGAPTTPAGFRKMLSRVGVRAGCGQFIRTCCATRAGSRWPRREKTCVRCKTGSAMPRSRTPFDIRHSLQAGWTRSKHRT